MLIRNQPARKSQKVVVTQTNRPVARKGGTKTPTKLDLRTENPIKGGETQTNGVVRGKHLVEETWAKGGTNLSQEAAALAKVVEILPMLLMEYFMRHAVTVV